MAVRLHDLLGLGAAERQIPEMATVTHGRAWNKKRTLPASKYVLAVASCRQAGEKAVFEPDVVVSSAEHVGNLRPLFCSGRWSLSLPCIEEMASPRGPHSKSSRVFPW